MYGGRVGGGGCGAAGSVCEEAAGGSQAANTDLGARGNRHKSVLQYQFDCYLSFQKKSHRKRQMSYDFA